MSATYIYNITPYEMLTRPDSFDIPHGTKVRLAKPPFGAPRGGLMKKFVYVEDLSGRLLGMASKDSLTKISK